MTLFQKLFRLPSKYESLGNRIDEKIDKFVDVHPELELQTVKVGKSKVLVIKRRSLPSNLDLTLYTEILKKQRIVDNGGISNNCKDIARDSVTDKTSDGVLYANQEASKLLPYFDHAVNYKNLADGTIIAVDYTAPSNYDHRRGFYNSFCIHVNTISELKTYLSELHGGEWVDKGKDVF